MARVSVTGAAAASWLAALALSRHGIGGWLCAAATVERSVSLAPDTLAQLRLWGVVDDDAGGSVPESALLREAQRRVAGFGLFAGDSEADAPLAIHAGDAGPGICIGAEVNTAVANLVTTCWRVAGRLRGWYGGSLLPRRHDVFDDPRFREHFDVKFVLLADADLAGEWSSALRRHAPHVPLDLLTVGEGGRIPESVPLPAAGGVLVAPGGEILAEWAHVPRNPDAALARALIGAGVRSEVLR